MGDITSRNSSRTKKRNILRKDHSLHTPISMHKCAHIDILIHESHSNQQWASHEIELDAEAAHKDGHAFFGNRFSDVVFAMGKWKQGHWDGKVGLDFLKIKLLR